MGSSTFYKAKRAYAFEFPIDAFSRGGRPPAESEDQDSGGESGSADADSQQRLDAGTDESNDTRRTETWGGDATGESGDADTASLLSELVQHEAGESGNSLRCEVDAAIETLEALQSELE